MPAADGKTVRLIDFASAGRRPAAEYVSWLPATGMRPPAPVAWQPADRAKVGPGPIRFSWRHRPPRRPNGRKHTVVIADGPTSKTSCSATAKSRRMARLPAEEAGEAAATRRTTGRWSPGTSTARRRASARSSGSSWTRPPRRCRAWPYGEREQDRMVTEAPLSGDVKPAYGKLARGQAGSRRRAPTAGPTRPSSWTARAWSSTSWWRFPEEDYTVSIWVAVTDAQEPLRPGFQRLVRRHGRSAAAGRRKGQALRPDRGRPGLRHRGLRARNGQVVPRRGRQEGEKLTLYVDGQARSSAKAPLLISPAPRDFAIGGNPNYGGPEFLPARFADLRFYARALSAEEVNALYSNWLLEALKVHPIIVKNAGWVGVVFRRDRGHPASVPWAAMRRAALGAVARRPNGACFCPGGSGFFLGIGVHVEQAAVVVELPALMRTQ